ncbi:hypothetical protein RIF29_24519 [Crotalaria pallida]|uniref:Uncharacterized protein n=1 Tax=Crotalaria pallida TaxID=3830 RepID=A0AAN9EKM0_CROPI
MTKKRGRPPRTPSSNDKHDAASKANTIYEPQTFDLSQLDEEDLNEISNLTPKKAEELLRNLDALRVKIQEKIPDANSQPSNSKGKDVKQHWVVKPKPTTEANPASDQGQISANEGNSTQNRDEQCFQVDQVSQRDELITVATNKEHQQAKQVAQSTSTREVVPKTQIE